MLQGQLHEQARSEKGEDCTDEDRDEKAVS